MQNEGHEFKSYKKTLKAKIVEFTAVRVSSMAAGNIGKMLRRMNIALEGKASRNLSAVLTDERNRVVAKIEQNDERYSEISELARAGHTPKNAFTEKHDIEFENDKLKVEVRALSFKIKRLSPYVEAHNFYMTKADNIKTKLNGKQLSAVEEIYQKVLTDAPVAEREEVAEVTTALVPVEEITKEITVTSEDLIKAERNKELAEFNRSRQEIIKPVEEPTVNAPTSEQDGLEGFAFLEEITRNIKAQKKANEDFTKHNKELRSELAIKTAQLSESGERNVTLSKTIKDKDAIIAKVEEEKRVMQEAMQAAAVKAITERNELQTQNKQTEARLKTTTEENQQISQQLREANETVTLITNDRDKLQKDNTNYQKIAVDATSKTQSVTIENNQLKTKLDALNGLIGSITKDRDQYLNELNNYKRALKMIQTSYSAEQVSVGQSESKQM